MFKIKKLVPFGWGGGIAIILSDNVVVVNNFITDNWTIYDGAGILVQTANVKVIHNTIRRNAIDTYWTGDGGMCIESGSGAAVDVVNTICWNDAYGPGGYDREFHLYQSGPVPATLTATYSDIRDGICPSGPCTGNVSIDPDFVSSFDSHLNATSPLIDIAVASAVTDDIDGDTRPQYAGPDIGADEVPGPQIEKTLVEGLEEIGIYLPDPTPYVFEITYSGPAAKVIDTVPAEFEIVGLDASDGTTNFFRASQGKGKSATRIEWEAPAGSNTLEVTIQTVASPGKGHKAPVFKPTSCGPLPLNDGAIAYEVDQGQLVLDDEGNPIVIVGPSNSLVVEAVEGAKPCEEG